MMESANQNRQYYQPWRVEPSYHSKPWNNSINSAYFNALAARRPIWGSGMGLMDRETSAFFVKPGSQPRYSAFSSHGIQPKMIENGGAYPILNHLPLNHRSMREEIFPGLYNYVGSSYHESQFDGMTSSRWVAAGSELIKLDPEPIATSIFKSPWSFIQNSSFAMGEQPCDHPGSKSIQHMNGNYSPIEAVRVVEQEFIRPPVDYITSAAFKTKESYNINMCSGIKYSTDDSPDAQAPPETIEEHQDNNTNNHLLPPTRETIDLTDDREELKDDSACGIEGNVLLIDDKGIPYTVSKTDLETLSKKAQEERSFQVPKKLHNCPMCFRTFLYMSDLERHSITHSEKKPFECEVCGKSFKRSSHLQRHKHIHTGERAFQCVICLKGFRESGELLRHQRVHTGEKPYQCNICHLRFTERNTLRRHNKRKHSSDTLQQQDAEDSSDLGETLQDIPSVEDPE
ncbi:zinc finger protein 524 [Bombina bombina]|uniref:zinc finger protein 524 n=1 Tax=Bombina bombina TaxID=8345 RepID=UPI00235A669A|nr:zinc finger protein 524 [Bombina bombina]XP_053546585.1 zinc finger protein 524 [Bombina bombina]